MFTETFGFDPWGKGSCYCHRLFHAMPCQEQGGCAILGIDCGLGSSSLKRTAHRGSTQIRAYPPGGRM